MNIFSLSEFGSTERILVALVIVVLAHLSVIAIRLLGHRLMTTATMLRWNKMRTLAGLITSALIFTLYFGALAKSLIACNRPAAFMRLSEISNRSICSSMLILQMSITPRRI